MQLLRSQSGRVSLIGHRGALASAPENTMASFEEGVRQGADMIELDVHLCASGEVVVIHDARVERTTNGRGRVVDLALAELQALDAGSWFDPRFRGQRIPTLDEVLAWARGRVPVVIEIKNGPVFYDGIEDKVVSLLEKHGMVDQVIVISFDHACLPRVKARRPDVATGILYVGRLADGVGAARAARADSLRPVWSYVRPEDVQQVHQAGLSVDPWGREVDYPWLIEIGVDSVSADQPDQVRALLDAG